jgi:N-acetylmuramoyl-L-alanine amidase
LLAREKSPRFGGILLCGNHPVMMCKPVSLALSGMVLLLAFSAIRCSGKYAAGRSYKKQAKAYAKLLRKYPVNDSLHTAPGWTGAVNFNMRKPNFVVIHHTAQKSCEQTLNTFTTVKSQVSAHYVICKDGTVHHMVNDLLRAWHGGAAKWGSLTDLNSASIGIELDNNGAEPFPEAQIGSLLRVLAALKKTHGIPVANFIGHADIAPRRKNDPNAFFPWKQLAQQGFGHWYDTTGVPPPPEQFNHLQAMRLIGYDISDSTAAIKAFKLHFVQTDSTRRITPADRKILFNLVRKYQ